jgi:hypothetical protein
MEEVKFDSYKEVVENFDELTKKLMKKSIVISVGEEKNENLEKILKVALVNETKFNLEEKLRGYVRKFTKCLYLSIFSHLGYPLIYHVNPGLRPLFFHPILFPLGAIAIPAGFLATTLYYMAKGYFGKEKKLDVLFYNRTVSNPPTRNQR